VLNSRCEQLADEFKLLDKRMQDKVTELEDRQQRELKKQRESILTAEKIRRDNWMQEKSKEIKEMTVKGLQPEIERLLAKVLYVYVWLCVCIYVCEKSKETVLLQACLVMCMYTYVYGKSKEIKEMTVKGLQPEIERLLAKVLYVYVWLCVCAPMYMGGIRISRR
jgi:hypothetical protein